MKTVVRIRLHQTLCFVEKSRGICLIINSSAFQRDRQFVSGLQNLTDRRKRLGWTRRKGKWKKTVPSGIIRQNWRSARERKLLMSLCWFYTIRLPVLLEQAI